MCGLARWSSKRRQSICSFLQSLCLGNIVSICMCTCVYDVITHRCMDYIHVVDVRVFQTNGIRQAMEGIPVVFGNVVI